MHRYSPGSRSYASRRAAIRRSVKAAGHKEFSPVSLDNQEPAANTAPAVKPDAVICADGSKIKLGA